ncbi:MAG: ester cyclase [Alphaproteobacteria bacterium]|nr:ester cyclase [Alphaproteobacteria bacterium]
MHRHLTTGLVLTASLSLLAACEPSTGGDDSSAEAEAILQAFYDQEALEAAHLATFDTLDFDVFTGQEWDRLSESHAQDVIVHWPDGHVTEGIDVHIQDLQGLFVWAPDTRIEEHPIRVASGEFTAVTGTMEGTFTEPMPIGDGNFIEPTGAAYRIAMATVSHWEDGTMDEEWLYWDNQSFYAQIGLGGE